MSAPYLSELEALRRETGGLRPEEVVARARNPRSPLHDYFEWDDGEAAERYRVSQARGLIRAVVSILPNPNGEPVHVRAYVSLPSDRHAKFGYRAIVDVMNDAAMAAEAKQALRDDLDRIRLKYRAFSELSAVLDAIEAAAGLSPPPRKRRGRRGNDDERLPA